MPNLNMSPIPAKMLNNQTFLDYYTRLRLLALSIFEWTGLPESISARYLESSLFEQGRVFVFQDTDLGLLCLRGGPNTELNIYGEPIGIRVNGFNGYNRELMPDEYVMIRNNYDSVSTEKTIRLFAQRLQTAERAIDVNINAQRTPLLILCDEKQRLTLKNVYAQYNGNEPVIYGDKSLNPDAIKSIKTEAQFVADRLTQYKRDIWNECMTFLGINNANTDKRERLIVPEVEANDQLVTMSAHVMLLTRQAAAEEISRLFNMSVTVKMREMPQDENSMAEEPETEVEDV